VDETPHPIVFLRGFFEDFFEMSSITKVKFTACAKLKNLARESFREQSGALCIDFAPLLDTAKLLAVWGDA
jgi:hypothetical protein